MLLAAHHRRNYNALIAILCDSSLPNQHTRNDCLLSEIAMFNCRSLMDKATVLSTLVTEKILDFLLLTESWQIPNGYLHLSLPGYSYLAKPHLTSRGGGLAAVYPNSISVKSVGFHDTVNFEYLVFKTCGPSTVLVVLLYRPPKPVSNFFQWTKWIVNPYLCYVLFCYITWQFQYTCTVDTNNAELHELMLVFECFNFEQHVNFPTHSKGHTLDLVCTTGLRFCDWFSSWSVWSSSN